MSQVIRDYKEDFALQAGRFADTATAAAITVERAAIDDISNSNGYSLDGIHNMISALEEALEPVMQPEYPKENTGQDTVPGGASPLYYRLSDQNESAKRAISRLHQIKERLEV